MLNAACHAATDGPGNVWEIEGAALCRTTDDIGMQRECVWPSVVDDACSGETSELVW